MMTALSRSGDETGLVVHAPEAKLKPTKQVNTLKEPVQPFNPQLTIFKTFEEKKGLEKLIGVLTGCIKNWVNGEQSKIWGQYLQ